MFVKRIHFTLFLESKNINIANPLLFYNYYIMYYKFITIKCLIYTVYIKIKYYPSPS